MNESAASEPANRQARSRKQADVLVSGRGANLQALILAAMDPAYPVSIKRVICNRPDAGALDIAARHGIPAVVLDHKAHDTRDAHEAAVAKVLESDRPDVICLAGYMRILTSDFVRRFSGRLINIHPSLLPSFRGVDTHERALAAGVRIHGASVHFVSEGVDEGPVIAQAAVPVLQDDDASTLAKRVLEAELKLYPHALAMVARGEARLSGGRTVLAAGKTQEQVQAQAQQALYSPPLPAGAGTGRT